MKQKVYGLGFEVSAFISTYECGLWRSKPSRSDCSFDCPYSIFMYNYPRTSKYPIVTPLQLEYFQKTR